MLWDPFSFIKNRFGHLTRRTNPLIGFSLMSINLLQIHLLMKKDIYTIKKYWRLLEMQQSMEDLPQKFRFQPQFNINQFPPCVIRPFTFRLPMDHDGSTFLDAYDPYSIQEYEERSYIILLFLRNWLDLEHLRATVDRDNNTNIMVSGQIKLPVLQFDFMDEHVDLYNAKESGLVLEWGITSLFRNLKKVGKENGKVVLEFSKEIQTSVPLDHSDNLSIPQPIDGDDSNWKVVEFPATGLWPPNSKEDSEIAYWVFKRIESPVVSQPFGQPPDQRSDAEDRSYFQQNATSTYSSYRYGGNRRARYRTGPPGRSFYNPSYGQYERGSRRGRPNFRRGSFRSRFL